MFVKRLVLVFLLLAALSSFTGTAMAQAQPQQFVIVYVEFKSADTKAGSEVLEALAAQAENSSGVIRFDVLQQVDRPNFFALFEIWTNAQTFAAFQNSSAAVQTQLTPLLEAPLDQRPGNLLTGTVNPRDQHAQTRQIFVITHVDVDPQNVPQAQPLLDTFVSDSLNDPGAETFALLSQTPTTNHFQLIETFANLKAFEAHVSEQHTVDFRTNIDPLLGAPYDERLYQFVNP
ncbi:MAG: antibiotic biosynthesis monooxygenase [Acidobacteriaceae bacterium]|nr:antibiotic biosynthesis monooxygenase [Acidobacteriaceae bacterium]